MGHFCTEWFCIGSRADAVFISYRDRRHFSQMSSLAYLVTLHAFAAAIISVVGEGGIGPITFTDCGEADAALRFTKVEVLPVSHGLTTKYRSRKIGVAKVAVEKPKITDVPYFTIFGKQRRLWNLTSDACSGILNETQCPLRPGPFVFEYDLILPRGLTSVVPGLFEDLQYYSFGDGRSAGCVKFQFNTTHSGTATQQQAISI